VSAAAELRPLAGPVPTPAGAYDLAALGYVEEEFLLCGEATSYRLLGERTPDGRWSATAAEAAPYTTRILVRRPADGTAFSGTVVVEWLNVSGGLDAPPIWMMTHTHLIRRRHAWIGVSAQRAGIQGGGMVDNGMHLKATFPDRYGALSHPGDAWSFDMFSQAGRAARGSAAVLGSHAAAAGQMIAAGHSQSAAFLVTYINAIDALAPVYDGFAVHGRTGSGASLEHGFTPRPPGTAGATAEAIRPDLRVPVLVLQTETDVALLGSGQVGQLDADLLRNWEIAGAAHGDTYLLIASGQDDGALPPARLAGLIRPTTQIVIATTEVPVNSGMQHHYVACAALEHIETWAGGGSAPPAAPRLDLAPGGTDFVRDKAGVATGGIRTPWTDVPAAVLSGVGQTGASLFAFLFGVTRPLDPDLLAALYPGGLAEYLARFEAALDETITAGFLLPADRAEALAVAEAAWPGPAAT
jgi:Alpha/beta hydrolase domain